MRQQEENVQKEKDPKSKDPFFYILLARIVTKALSKTVPTIIEK